MKPIHLPLFFVVAATLILSSCTVEKRVHMPGYHVEWNHRHHDHAKSIPPENISRSEVQSPLSITEPAEEITASVENDIPEAIQKDEARIATRKVDGECDRIVMADGSMIEAKVVEIGESDIRYKKCDNLDGPVYVAKKSEVLRIEYPNGTQDTFTVEPSYYSPPEKAVDAPRTSSASPTIPEVKRKFLPSAVVAFIFAAVGLFVPYIGILLELAAFILAIVAISKISSSNGKYRGLGLAIAALVITILIAIAIVLLFALLISL